MEEEIILKGLPISSGISYASVCMFNESRHNNLPDYRVEGLGLYLEKQRLHKAINAVSNKLEKLILSVQEKIGSPEAEIFHAQKMILFDPTIQESIIKSIENNKSNAETAIVKTFEMFEKKIMELDNEYMKERATDIGDVKRRLLDSLSNLSPSLQCSNEKNCQKGKNRIIVAEELTPSLTLNVDTEFTKAFITEKGGITSHAAILARSLKIPAVSGIKNIHKMIYCGTRVIVNGNSGEVIINPKESTLLKFPEINDNNLKAIEITKPIEGFKVLANLNLSKDIDNAIKYNAEGIGLYRTEFEHLSSGKLLSEEEQLERYVNVIRNMKDKKIYFRLVDIGGDKNADFFKLEKEENPYLGFRGSRLLLGRQDIFKPQARAIAKASKEGKIYVMYPMIIDKEQFLKIKSMFIEFTNDIKDTNILHGVMFEVPSACLQSDEILKEADFGSIGSNDLIQYLYAVDRNNENVAYDYSYEKPILWNLLQIIANSAKKHNKPLSLCGELASNPNYVKRLKEIGITTISVSPKIISSIRKAL